ncbi:MAG: helix-turn-helix domain-containing protein [Firmicutes bacterium]|nr:helix-turn-helix domain-containing protein [Bacillota bacterium]
MPRGKPTEPKNKIPYKRVKRKGNNRVMYIYEAAEILDIGVNRAYELAREGVIPSIKIGGRVRVPTKKFYEWLEGLSESGPQQAV